MKLALLGVIGAFVLTGCSSGTLPCNDGDIKDTVLDIIASNINNAKWAIESQDAERLGNFSIDSIKTISYDENIDFYSCAGTFHYEFDDKPVSNEFTYELSYLEDSGETDIGVYNIDRIKVEMMVRVGRGGTIKK